MSVNPSMNENKAMLIVAVIFVLLLFVYFNFDTTTGEARKLSNLSKYHLQQNELSSYFGEIIKAKPIGYVINGNRRKRFPGKAMICFKVKGAKAEGKIEFQFTYKDTAWVLDGYAHGPCGSYTY